MSSRKKSQFTPRFKQQSMKMAKDHTWSAPDGYKIFVADRGLVSFNMPEAWLIHKLEPHIEIHDALPPNDETRLSVSYWRFPPGIDWSGLPLAPLLTDATKKMDTDILEQLDIQRVPRDDIELIWNARRFLDTGEPREAWTRTAMGRGFDVHVLITCDFWVSDLPRIAPVWDEILRSLQLGRYIEDPLKGPRHH